jgi:hypothetical protein
MRNAACGQLLTELAATPEPERSTILGSLQLVEKLVKLGFRVAVEAVERECGLPVVSASICTTYQMLRRLGLRTYVPHAGTLLSGNY